MKTQKIIARMRGLARNHREKGIKRERKREMEGDKKSKRNKVSKGGYKAIQLRKKPFLTFVGLTANIQFTCNKSKNIFDICIRHKCMDKCYYSASTPYAE